MLATDAAQLQSLPFNDSNFAKTQESRRSKISDIADSIQDVYLIGKAQIAGSPYTTARQLKKELARTVTRHMTDKEQQDDRSEALKVIKNNVGALRMDPKKLYTAQSPRGSAKRPTGPQTQHGQRSHILHGSFAVAPNEIQVLPSYDAYQLDPEDKVSIH